MKKNVMLRESLVRVPEPPSTRHGGCVRASRESSSSKTPWQAALGRDAPPFEAEMGTPVLVGARGREGATQRLVSAAVDLGLELRRDGIQGLLEVGVVATTVRLLQPLPG